MKLDTIIDTAERLLSQHNEWKNRYKGYREALCKQSEAQLHNRKLIRVKAPLYLYSSISKAINSVCEYDLRYKGQSIATVKVQKDNAIALIPNNSIAPYFGYQTPLPCHWHSTEGRRFRKHFYDLPNTIEGKSAEHALENSILAEFSKRSSQEKSLLNIQSITLNTLYFQMPTPFSASGKTLKYSAHAGGGIDVMARIRVKGKATNANSEPILFELKDENKAAEPVEKAMCQALAYGVFMAQLLTEDKAWLKLFGFNGNPDTLHVCTLMPNGGKDDAAFQAALSRLSPIHVGDYRLQLHTLFFDPHAYKSNQRFKFSGSLLDVLN